MVYTTYSCCFHHKIKTPKYIWFIICINTNTGDLHANLFSIYLPYGVNGASWCLSMPAMVLPGTMEIASLRSLAEMMESDVWTLKLNWMSQVLVSWQVCFQVSVFFCGSDEMMSIITVCQACKGVNGRSCGKCYKMEYPSCSICHSSLHHLAQGSQKGAGFLCLTAPFRPGIIGVRCPLASTLPWAFKAKQCLAQMPFADLASVSLIF